MGPNVRKYKMHAAFRVIGRKLEWGMDRGAAISPDGRWVALYSGEFHVVDVIEKRIVGGNDDFDWSGDIMPVGGNVFECCFSPDGRRLGVVQEEAESIHWTMFDVEPSGKLSLRYQFERDAYAVSRAATTEAPTSIAFSPDGRLWATWLCPSWSGRAVILDVDTGKLVSFAFIHNDQLGDAPYSVDLVFNRDGSRLAVHTILGIIWLDTTTGEPVPAQA